MSKVILLVCAAGIAHGDCQPENALYLLNGPHATEASCGMRSQAFLAQTWIGRSLANGEYLKIVCARDDGPGPPEKPVLR